MTETDKLLPALAKAQATYPKVGKLKSGHYGKYADLVSIMEAVRKPNTEAGLIVIHRSDVDDFGSYSETRVIHTESGQWIGARMRLDPSLTDQSMGKSLTYFRRYCVMGLLGICADEDTDGQEAEDEQRTRRSVRSSAKKPAKGAAADKIDDAMNAGLEKSDREVKALGAWWASVRDVMNAGGIITDPKTQNDIVREMIEADGYESSKDLSGAKRNELLLEVRRLYGKDGKKPAEPPQPEAPSAPF